MDIKQDVNGLCGASLVIQEECIRDAYEKTQEQFVRVTSQRKETESERSSGWLCVLLDGCTLGHFGAHWFSSSTGSRYMPCFAALTP